MRIKFIASTLALLALGFRAAGADQIEAALYFGENSPAPFFARLAPPDLNERLHQVFGFRHYELIKADKIDLDRHGKQWFVPRRDFFICVRPLLPQPDEPRWVGYEIYQDGVMVAKGRYEASEGTPLFINGPDFRNGRLILVLETR